MADRLLKEDGFFLLKEDSGHILLDPTLTTSLATSPDVRITVYDHAGGLLQLNAIGDFTGGHIQYENMPKGCGAATLQAGVLWEDAIAKGYYAARNIIEISTADDVLTAACAAGATKLYVTANTAYAGTFEPDAQQIYLYDGGQLCMRIPVTGTGSDGGGPYITVGTPVAGGGNPVAIPAMPAGTLVGRRRYSGQIIKRGLENSKLPKTIIYCGSLSQRINEALGTFTITLSAAVDIGTAVYNIVKQFAARWPELTITAGNFASVGKNAAGTYDRQTVQYAITDLLNQVTSGDTWQLYIGHDRIVRLIRLYTSSGNTYAYNQTLHQGVQSFEAVSVKNDDQDASQLINSFEVIGDTDPVTKQPVRGIYQDAVSIGLYGQIDAPAYTNVGCKTAAQCADLARAIANAQSVARQNAQVRVYIDEPGTGPLGLTQGDIIAGVTNVTIADFEGAAPNIYGLCVSAVTTLDAVQCYRYQDVKFSAVEPDWNAAMAERGNALANALNQNTRTGAAIDQYCVSVDAFPASGIPTAGLVVSPPTFLALFAPNTAVQTITSPTFTCVASSTNWAWLNPNATWTVKQDPSIVAGAILYAIFMCDSTNVIGQFQRAPVGVLKLDPASIPDVPAGTTMTVTAVTINSYSGATGGAATANITFTPNITSSALFSTWGMGFQYLAKVNDTGSLDSDANALNYVPVGFYNSSAFVSGTALTDTFGPLGAGHAWQIAIQPISQRGNGGVVVPFALTTVQTISNASQTAMPSSVKTNGPTISASSITTARATSAGSQQRIGWSMTETDFTSSYPAWLDGIWEVVRLNGIVSTTNKKLDYKSSTTGVYTGNASAPFGQSVDIGFFYTDLTGATSATVYPAALTDINDPAGTGLDGIPDGTTQVSIGANKFYGTGANKRARIDFTDAHDNKNQDNVPDGSTRGAVLNTVLTGNIPDLSKPIVGKNLDNISDTATRSGILTTETNGSAGSRTVKQVNDGTTTRTAGAIGATLSSQGVLLSPPIGASENMALNPSFESATWLAGASPAGFPNNSRTRPAGFADFWYPHHYPAYASIDSQFSVISGGSIGASCAQIAVSAAQPNAVFGSHPIPVKPGDVLYFSADIAGTGTIPANGAYLRFAGFAAATTDFQWSNNNWAPGGWLEAGTPTGTFTTYTSTSTVPAGTYWVVLSAWATGGGTPGYNLQVDNVKLFRGNKPHVTMSPAVQLTHLNNGGTGQDGIAEGSTYAKVKATELQGGSGGAGTVKQVNDGTTTRTAAQVGTVVAAALDSNNSGLVHNSVASSHILGSSVDNTRVLPAIYATQSTNTLDSSTEWSDSANTALTPNQVLTNGSSYNYKVVAAYAGSSNSTKTYSCPGSGSVTMVFKHLALSSGAYGTPTITFSGTQVGGSTVSATSSVSGSQNVTWSGNPKVPGPGNTYSKSNGSQQSFSVTTSVGPDATHYLELNLSSVVVNSDADGSSSFTVLLYDPSNALVASALTVVSGSGTAGAAGTGAVTGITAASDIKYQPGVTGATGTYTWKIQAIASNGNVAADVPYSSTYTDTFSGLATYWTGGGGVTGTYVLALDGATQRFSAGDNNVKLSQFSADTIAFAVTNSNASNQLFSLSVSVSGV